MRGAIRRGLSVFVVAATRSSGRRPKGPGLFFTHCRIAQINLTTGVLTPIGAYLNAEDLPCAVDLAFSPSGVLYGIVR